MRKQKDGLSYKDAVRLLQGTDTAWAEALDKALGGAILAASAVNPGALALIAPKNELVKVSRKGFDAVAESISGLGRSTRTERLEAAHAVLVVSSYLAELSALVEATGQKLDLTAAELLDMLRRRTEGDSHQDSKELMAILVRSQLPTPSAGSTRAQLREDILQLYKSLAPSVAHMMHGLRLFDQLNQTQWERLTEAIAVDAPIAALQRYDEDYRLVASQVTEFQIWGSLSDTATMQRLVDANQAELREQLDAIHGLTESNSSSLQRFSDYLQRATEGVTPPAGVRRSLAAVYQAHLTRPILSMVDSEPGALITPPTIGRAYVRPAFREVAHTGNDRPSSDFWWETMPRRDDIEEFLATYFTTSASWSRPLLVLGQPGAGKSILTRIVAAQLPPESFIAIRVPLRTVDANAPITLQIEDALHQALNEEVSWASLRREAAQDGAIPVVLLDGFDELLQASGASRSNYLEQVQDFQRTEADLGHRVAVVVTSRTVVAGRARIPFGSVVLRLDPFDDDQVAEWLTTWNEANATMFTKKGIAPLEPTTVLAQGEIARQPILLLMLAVYDADGNPLRGSTAGLRRATLYERLLERFVEREVGRESPGLEVRAHERAIAGEFERLEIVALSMFSRKRQDVREPDLERDFEALFGTVERSREGFDLNVQLSRAQSMLGRFFFVHRAELSDSAPSLTASRDAGHMVAARSYEFLHATFGEFLVARSAARHLYGAFQGWRSNAESISGGRVDARQVRRFFSSQPFTNSPQVVSFLQELRQDLPPDLERDFRDFFETLLLYAFADGAESIHEQYNPGNRSIAPRLAAFRANVVLLHLTLLGTIEIVDDRPFSWPSTATLWRSQFDEESWLGLRGSLQVHAVHTSGVPGEWPTQVVVKLGRADVPCRDVLALMAEDSGHRYVIMQDRLAQELKDAQFIAGTVRGRVAAGLLSSPTLVEAFGISIETLGVDEATADGSVPLPSLSGQLEESVSLAEILLMSTFESDLLRDSQLQILFDAASSVVVIDSNNHLATRALLAVAHRHFDRLGPLPILGLCSRLLGRWSEVDADTLVELAILGARLVASLDGEDVAPLADGTEPMNVLDGALSRLDLPHILGSKASVELFDAVDQWGLTELLPEFDSPEDFLFRFDPRRFLDRADVLNRLLDIARRNDEKKWARHVCRTIGRQTDIFFRLSVANRGYLARTCAGVAAHDHADGLGQFPI
jgi:hypothetical protein